MKNKVFFVGIKGTGMASLALILDNLGYEVSGSDISRHFFPEDALREKGIPIYEFGEVMPEDGSIVIIGNAFLDDHEEVNRMRNNKNLKSYRYHEFLGKLMSDYRSIAISGSHGKTTTTTMVKEMLDYNTNAGYLIGDGQGFLETNDTYFAVEACEYRHHFLAYKPDVAIMTNFELDHVDYFKSEKDYLEAFESFSKNVKELIIAWGDDPNYSKLTLSGKVWTYGFSDTNTLQAIIKEEHSTHTVFEVYFKQKYMYTFDLNIVGKHLVLDALATIAVGLYENLSCEDIEAGLLQFKGAKRRYVVEDMGENIYIDDYAHHPTEIKVTLEATRTRFPNHKIVAIFKPHRVGRVYHFGDEFAQALTIADEVGLCPFTSIDDYEEGIDIDITYLQDKIPGSFIVKNDNDIHHLQSLSPAVFVFMSSKDIYDLKDNLKHRLSR